MIMTKNRKELSSLDTTQQLNKQKQMQAEIDRLNNILKLFIYSTSHDLRAPILSIKGLVNLIQNNHSGSKNEHYFQLINQVIDKHDLNLQNYREFLQISDIELNAEEINFEALADEAFTSMKHLDLKNEIRKSLVIKSPGYRFRTDVSHLKIIIQNLVSNALKFQRPSEKNKLIRINVEINDQQCTLEVCDNGIGIDHATEQYMFDMFYRGNNGNHGSGLGLYIVRKLVKNMKGYINFERKPNKISCFKVILPNII